MPDSTRDHVYDPHRRTRRHRYQEGPGFLFLATQNGRPPKEIQKAGLERLRLRMRAVRLAREVGVEAACQQLAIARRSLYRWSALFESGGINGLQERSRRPHRLRTQVPGWVDTVIIAIRLHTYWNSKRIAAEMSRRQIFKVGPDHIDHLFQTFGCSRGAVPRPPGPRYERDRPNELWHVDIKGPFFINFVGRGYLKTWIVGLVDDHSRFVIGLRILPTAKAGPILQWLDECFELCGEPIQLMSDNGSPFVFWMPGVLTLFGKRLQELHIQHLRTQISSPWTNGKIEAFWAILQGEVLDPEHFGSLADAEAALARFARYYNYHRLSGALGWLTPAERYDGTPFTDRGFEHIPALSHLQPWLERVMDAA
ncbi:MAG: integrase core domain-containing protein [Isosphaerales bacterium]